MTNVPLQKDPLRGSINCEIGRSRFDRSVTLNIEYASRVTVTS